MSKNRLPGRRIHHREITAFGIEYVYPIAGKPVCTNMQFPHHLDADDEILFLLLVTILAKSLFAFVRCNLVPLTFFSTRHSEFLFLFYKMVVVKVHTPIGIRKESFVELAAGFRKLLGFGCIAGAIPGICHKTGSSWIAWFDFENALQALDGFVELSGLDSQSA